MALSLRSRCEDPSDRLRGDMGLFARLKRTFGLGRNEADIRKELQFHLDMDMAGGKSAREACAISRCQASIFPSRWAT